MNYQEVIDNLNTESVIKLMTRLGADRYKEEHNCVIFPTICHHSESSEASMKLYYYKNTKIFVCYSNCQAMSIFKFLEHYYEARGIDDYDWVNDIYNVALDCSNFTVQEGFKKPKYTSLASTYGSTKRPVSLPSYNEGALDTFIPYFPPEWGREGIIQSAAERFDIRYSISQNKIIIPHRDVNGRLIGVRGRALNEWEIENIGKYAPVRLEQTWYKHPLSMNLYGLFENKDTIKKCGICYIFEAEKSVLMVDGFSTPNCSVAVCGSQLNIFQLKILLKECQPKEIVICFDREELPSQTKYFDKLWRLCQRYKNYAQFSFIYDREGLTKMKDSPVDRGELIFQKLLTTRVRVR